MCAGYPGHRRRQYGCLTKRPAQTRQPSATTGSRPPILSMASQTPPTSSCACSASQGLAVDTAWSCGLHVCCRYLWRAGYISVNNPYWMAVILVCGLVWLGSLSFGRMYLGVHSPSDVEGGVVRFRASCRGNQEASVRVPTWCCFPGYWRQHHACHILVRHRNRLLDRCE